MKILFRRRAPELPPLGPARRVNRLNAAMALFGAFGALAWAMALTSGTQTSRSNAKDSHGQLAISEIRPQPTAAAEASPPAPILAALPQQAGNPDRLSRSIRAPQPAAAEALDEATDEAVTASPSAAVSTDVNMRARPDNAVAAIMVDSPGQLAISEVKPQPRGAAEPNSPKPVLAGPPQQPANPDRLSRTIRAPQPAAADRLPTTRSLRSPVRDKVSESDIPRPRKKPSTESRSAAVSKRILEQIFDEEASESPAPGNPGIDDDTGVGDIDTGGEVSALEIDEASEQASDEAPDEAAATRSAAVSTDVNMRAKPDNAAAVIMVVPGKSDVEVMGCDDWCEVVVAGKRGWIYHRFVGAADSTAGKSETTGVAGTTDGAAETTITSALPARRTPVAIDGIGRLASLSADDLQKNLRALDLGDVRRLKTTCAEVLRSSAAYSANTRAVCKLVASL